MAKLTKNELKSILKECLKEILHEEGILLAEGSAVSRKEETEQTQRQNAAKTRLFEHVNSVASNFGESDVMRKIFEDTAITTLQKQEANGHSVGLAGGASVPMLSEVASVEQVKQDKQQLSNLSFGGDISRWAKVAFANKQQD